jgi:hypothetical protein
MLLLSQLLQQPLQSFRAFLGSKHRDVIFTICLLAVIIAYSLVLAGYPAITFPWYLNTEEFPYIQEVLRFVDLDFKQQFFDIPGTPLMLLGTFLWSIYYWICVAIGNANLSQGIRYFSFEHMQSLYLLMRLISYFFYVLSIVLTFIIARRLTNSVGGFVAALLLSLSPIYGLTILYLRIESTSLSLVLLSIWLMLKAIDSLSYRLYLFSGIMAGLAMAVRFPSLLAGIPVLLAYCVAYPFVFSDRTHQKLNSYFFFGILSLLTLAGITSSLVKFKLLSRNLLTDTLLLTAEGQYPKATGTIQSLWLLLFAISITLVAAYIFPKTRSLLEKLIHSPITTVFSGCFLGVLLGMPTILWSGNYFLASVEMFSIRNKLGQSFIHSLFDVVYFFLFGLQVWNAPNANSVSTEVGIVYTYWHVILLILGLLIVFIKRQKIFYPIVFGALVGVLSQYGKLQTTRHIIAWLPYFLMIMSLPIAHLYEELRGFFKDNKKFERAFSLGIIALLFISIYKVQVNSLQVIRGHFQDKTILLPQMDQWIETHTTTTEKVFHTCCEPVNQEAILDWMQRNGVKIPAGIKKSERSIIWFGDKESLVKQGKGYIVISTTSFPGQYIDYYKKMRPESLTDPFTDKHFVLKEVVDPTLERKITYRIYYFDFT